MVNLRPCLDQTPWLLDVPHQATVKGAAWLVYFCDVQVCSLSKRHRWGRLAEHESQLFTWITQAHTARRRLLRHKLGSSVAVSWNEEFIFRIYFHQIQGNPADFYGGQELTLRKNFSRGISFLVKVPNRSLILLFRLRPVRLSVNASCEWGRREFSHGCWASRD